MRSDEVKFCPKCGQTVALELRFGEHRPVCNACGFIYFSDPKVAAAVLVKRDEQVLLVRRAHEPFRGLWTLPAGFVNSGEDPAEAAARECVEETGLRVEITGILAIISGREHPRGSDFVIFFAGQVTGGRLQAGDDAEAAEWFDSGQLPQLAFQSTKRIFEQF
jgi:ADP-ribose pyrophosphatase YjhB (NUDIX family)